MRVCFNANQLQFNNNGKVIHKKPKSDKSKIKLLYENRVCFHWRDEKIRSYSKVNYDWPLFGRCLINWENENVYKCNNSLKVNERIKMNVKTKTIKTLGAAEAATTPPIVKTIRRHEWRNSPHNTGRLCRNVIPISFDTFCDKITNHTCCVYVERTRTCVVCLYVHCFCCDTFDHCTVVIFLFNETILHTHSTALQRRTRVERLRNCKPNQSVLCTNMYILIETFRRTSSYVTYGKPITI